MNDLRLSIRQTYAAIGLDLEFSKQQIRSPRGEQTLEQPAAKMDFSSERSELTVDSSKAWHALGKGPNLEWNSGIYSQMQSVFLQHLAQQVAEGERMADITNPRSAFADLAQDALFRPNPVNYQIERPDFNNVVLNYSPGSIDTHIEQSPVRHEYNPRKVEIDVLPGKLDIYLRQKNSITIEVTPYDIFR